MDREEYWEGRRELKNFRKGLFKPNKKVIER